MKTVFVNAEVFLNGVSVGPVDGTFSFQPRDPARAARNKRKARRRRWRR